MKTTLGTESAKDEQLVEWSLTGDREAFGRIVERYQSLVCSITYGATGSLSLSEDIAQDTFVTAWRQLTALNDATKLRAWLCGIARNLVNNSLRRRQREPVRTAETLDAIHELAAPEPSPSALAVSREEEAILWRALERIPDTYREPLILFYREQQSVERVAEELELSEDAVKQRLSRGRKLLAEEVAAFVETTLQRTTPGRAFTIDVLAALPLAAASVGAAGVGAAAKGTAAAKSGFLAAWLVTLAPFVGIFAGITSQWLVIRATSQAGRERRVRTIELIAIWICVLVFAVGGEAAVKAWGYHQGWGERSFFIGLTTFWWLYAMIFMTWFTVIGRRQLTVRQQREEAGEIIQVKPGTRVSLSVGTHLAMSLWLITIAWQANDRLTAGIIAGLMAGLTVWNLISLRGLVGFAAARADSQHYAWCILLILVVLNLRLDAWLASRYEVSVAEIHRLFPMWIIPSLTLALLIWIGILLAMTRPKPAR
jgi:RNA polymerase sigma factor (sigma-70 family)